MRMAGVGKRACRRRRAVMLLGMAVTAASLPGGARAASDSWTNTAGGNFNTPGNWNSSAGPVPGSGDTAQFAINNSYTTIFDISPQNTSFNVSQGNVAWATDGSAKSYTLSGSPAITGGTLTLATSGAALSVSMASLNVNTAGQLSIDGGNHVSTSAGLGLGTVGGNGSLVVDGLGSSLSVAGSANLGQGGLTGFLTVQNNATATFSGTLSLAPSVSPNTKGIVTVQGAASVTAGTIVMGTSGLAGQQGNITLNDSGSSITQTGASQLTIGAASASNATLTIGSGASFTTGAGATTVNATGVISLNGGSLKATGPLTVAGGTINYNSGSLSAGSVTLTGTAKLLMTAGRDKALVATSLSIASPANLDLSDNSIILNYGNETTNATRDTIRNLLINGRNAAPGNPAPWNGLGGITSSYAHTNGNGSNLAIGYADNAQLAIVSASGSYTSFGGQTVGSSTILIMMARGADANLDGKVDGQDVSIIGTHFNKPGSGQWYFGDFDYSGSCDGADVSVLGTTFGKTSPTLSPAQLTAEFGSAFMDAFQAGQSAAAVPEPAIGCSLLAGAVLFLGRRRSRRLVI
jgi:hypothetical protein